MNGRREQLMSLLSEGGMSIKEMASKLYVSEMTVRRAVKPLIDEGLITHSRGRISLNMGDSDISYSIRRDVDQDEKIRIARRAAELLQGGEMLFIDGSTTCSHLLPELVKRKPRLVVTNSLDLCTELGNMGILTKITGGDYNTFDRCVEGYGALKFIEAFNFDIAFLSAKGIDSEQITDTEEGQSNVRRAVLEQAKRSVFLMSHSKYGKRFQRKLCNVTDVTVITDTEE